MVLRFGNELNAEEIGQSLENGDLAGCAIEDEARKFLTERLKQLEKEN